VYATHLERPATVRLLGRLVEQPEERVFRETLVSNAPGAAGSVRAWWLRSDGDDREGCDEGTGWKRVWAYGGHAEDAAGTGVGGESEEAGARPSGGKGEKGLAGVVSDVRSLDCTRAGRASICGEQGREKTA